MANEVRASHILVSTEQAANDLKAKIEGGEDFGAVAKANSSCRSGAAGGDLGFFGRGMMVAEFEKAAFDANVNEVVGPVQTQFGYHLIKVTEAR